MPVTSDASLATGPHDTCVRCGRRRRSASPCAMTTIRARSRSQRDPGPWHHRDRPDRRLYPALHRADEGDDACAVRSAGGDHSELSPRSPTAASRSSSRDQQQPGRRRRQLPRPARRVGRCRRHRVLHEPIPPGETREYTKVMPPPAARRPVSGKPGRDVRCSLYTGACWSLMPNRVDGAAPAAARPRSASPGEKPRLTRRRRRRRRPDGPGAGWLSGANLRAARAS